MSAGGTPIVQERVIAAPPERVFAAWSDAERMGRWMCPGEIERASVELDFRVGGRFRISMFGEEQTYVQHGEYLEIEAPHRIVFTWHSEWMPEGERDTRVSVTLAAESPDATRLRLVHDELPRSDSYEGHRGGWSSIVEKLANTLDA